MERIREQVMKYEDWLFGRDGALFRAASKGELDLVKELAADGANIAITSKNGYTPLHRAAQNGHADIVKFLISKGAQPALATANGETALSLARKNNLDEVVKILQGQP
jgi:ankyrin repeat protein